MRIDDVDGVANSTVVLEDSPEEEGYHTSEVCLERGDYEFAILDSYGDGIARPGYYSVVFDGAVIAQGGGFGSEERVSFTLPLPSSSPSESSSPSKFPSASFQPSESIVPSQTLSPSLPPSHSFSPSTYWSTFNWNRQGPGFNGDASNDNFGRDVGFSADALTMAVGAPGGNEGYVKVYRREAEGSSWEQRGDTLRGEASGSYFGGSLALSKDGTTLAVGAPYYGPGAGQVKVYEWDEAASNYLQIGDTLYGAAIGDEFGWSLDISDDKILAVAAQKSDDNGSDSGKVTIYAWNEENSNYEQRGEAIDGDTAGDQFGYEVSLSGNGQRLAVGAPWNGSNGPATGQVRVFEWDKASSNYTQLGRSLLAAAYDYFGVSTSFSHDGTTLAVGAPENGENGERSGQVKVFAWDEAASNFEQVGQSLSGEPYGYFGASATLSSDGKILAAGASEPGGPGYVKVYEWDEAASEYKQIGQNLGGNGFRDLFGSGLALAVTGNGTVMAVGAPSSDRNGTDSGRVEVFGVEL